MTRHNAHWKLAVGGYRAIGIDLMVVAAGFVTLVWTRTAGLAILAIGLGAYFTGAVFVFVEVHQFYIDLRPSQPDYARVHQRLLRDVLHVGSFAGKTTR